MSDSIKQMIEFGVFNLLRPAFVKGKYDIIFCRNLFFFFDKESQEKAYKNLSWSLKVGGYLILGGADYASVNHHMVQLMPGIYQKLNDSFFM